MGTISVARMNSKWRLAAAKCCPGGMGSEKLLVSPLLAQPRRKASLAVIKAELELQKNTLFIAKLSSRDQSGC